MTEQGYIKNFEGDKRLPETTSTMVTDLAKNQALSQTLLDTPDKDALGYPAFSTVVDYSAGDVVYYANKLWKFTADHAAGAWTGEDVDAFDIMTDVADFKEGIAEDYARKDGYYGQMGVGVADNLAGRGTVPAEYTFRTSGGTADLGTGSASIDKLMGKTLVWNQLVNNGNFATTDGWSDGDSDTSFSISSNIATIEKSGNNAQTACFIKRSIDVAAHKYYVSFKAKSNNDGNRVRILLYGVGDTQTPSAWTNYADWTKVSLVFASANANTQIRVYGDNYGDTTQDVSVSVSNIQVIDLTLMFGAGYEPSTAAEFEAFYPLDYYAYTATPQLINVTASGIKTVGFNLFNPATGKVIIPSPTSGNTTSGIGCVQISGTYTSVTDGDGNEITPSAGGFFNVGAATELTVVGGNATDTCIHYTWSGYRNGEYEPYEEHIIYFNGENGSVATVTGKLNGEGESVTICPEGMKSVGTGNDEFGGYANGYLTKATKRILKEDLGNLIWSYTAATDNYPGYFSSGSLVGVIKEYASDDSKQILTAQYMGGTSSYQDNNDKSIRVIQSNSTAHGRIWLRDDSHDGTSLNGGHASWLEGVYAYIELATPEEYTLDEPIPANYYVNDFGTEQRLPADTASVVAAPIHYKVQYAMNAVDTIRRLPVNYISTASMENFTTELASKLGTFLNATITVTPTYDSEHEEYDYSITIVENQQEP